MEGRGNGEVKSERGMMGYKWYKSMWRWMGIMEVERLDGRVIG